MTKKSYVSKKDRNTSIPVPSKELQKEIKALKQLGLGKCVGLRNEENKIPKYRKNERIMMFISVEGKPATMQAKIIDVYPLHGVYIIINECEFGKKALDISYFLPFDCVHEHCKSLIELGYTEENMFNEDYSLGKELI